MNKLALIQGIENLTFSIKIATEKIKEYLKNADGPTTHYIWRTKGDGKVRSRHENSMEKSLLGIIRQRVVITQVRITAAVAPLSLINQQIIQ